MSAIRYGWLAFELRPASRLSTRTTRNWVERAGTWASVQSDESYPIPITRTSGGPSPWTS